MRYTVDTMESDDDVIQRHLDKIFPALFKRILAPVPTWCFVRTDADRQLARSIAEFNSAVAGFIEQARQRMRADPSLRQHPGNLLEAMIAAANEPSSGIDDSRVVGDVASPTLDQMEQLSCVDAYAHKTMRLKPVAPIILLEILHAMMIGDVQVPAGLTISSLMRRDSVSDKCLPRAAKFEPERWLGGGEHGTQAHAVKRLSMPFSAAPRICSGRYLALLEMKMAMAALLGNFDIESVDTPDGHEAR